MITIKTWKIAAFGEPLVVSCDQKCELSKGDISTIEGSHSKPENREFNKWCYRQCDRYIEKKN